MLAVVRQIFKTGVFEMNNQSLEMINDENLIQHFDQMKIDFKEYA